MEATFQSLMKSIKSRKFDPVYFLQGEEIYFIDEVSKVIERDALSDAEKGFNQVVMYGKESPMASILTNARRFPMMAEKQVVIVKEAQDIPDLGKEAGEKLLLDYLSHPVPSTILVFCHPHKTLDKRKSLGKNIGKLATTLTSKKLYDNQLPAFVSEQVAALGFRIEEQAIAAFCEYIGNSLSRLMGEIEKLTINLKPGDTIRLDQVISQIGISREYNIFELQKAVVGRDMLMAMKVANFYASNTRKNPVIPAVAFLFSFFSKLLAAHKSEDKSKEGLVKALKISPFSAKDYSFALMNYSIFQTIRNIGFLREADLRLKGVDAGALNEGAILHELVFKLLSPATTP